MKKIYLIYIVIAILTVVLTGCVSVDYPKRKYYSLNVTMPYSLKQPLYDKVLAVNNITVAPQFSSLSFVYRLTDINYTRDYYNIFFNSPGQQIEQAILQYFKAINIFKYVVSDADIMTPDYVLHLELLELYADYRDSARPKAVITIHFIMFEPGKQPKILLDRTYRRAIPLRRKDTPSLIQAWSEGLGDILQNSIYSVSHNLLRVS